MGAVIKYHNFEKAKRAIKEFSEQTTTDLELERVDESKGLCEFLFGGGLGFSHKVTGEELNNLTSQIQKHLQNVNKTQIDLIKEFGQVYGALEALDKDYIQAILISIKATEATSEAAKQLGESNQQNQKDISKIVNNQKITLDVLKNFKQKLDSYAHLGDIDKIWNDCQKWHNEINNLSAAIDGAVERSCESIEHIKELKEDLLATQNKIDELSKTISSIQQSVANNHEQIRELLDFAEKISTLNHLWEVDELWNRAEDYGPRIKQAEQNDANLYDKLKNIMQTSNEMSINLETNSKDISNLKAYKDKLDKVTHIEDVDTLWQSVEKHSEQFIEEKKKVAELANSIQHNTSETDKKFQEVLQAANMTSETLNQKIKRAYWLAGGAAGIAVISLAFLFMKG